MDDSYLGEYKKKFFDTGLFEVLDASFIGDEDDNITGFDVKVKATSTGNKAVEVYTGKSITFNVTESVAHNITIIDGTITDADGKAVTSAISTTKLTVKANAKQNKKFSYWLAFYGDADVNTPETGNSLEFEDWNEATTSFFMVDKDVTIKAFFENDLAALGINDKEYLNEQKKLLIIV